MPSKLFKIREKINLFLFDSKAWIIPVVQLLNFVVFFIVLGCVVYYLGFPNSIEFVRFCEKTMEYTLAFFIMRYLVYIIYDFHPLDFIKKNRIEGIVLLFFLLYTVFPSKIDQLIGSYSSEELYDGKSILLFQFYFLLIIIIRLSKLGSIITKLPYKPSVLLILSFAILISTGTGLLMLPEMTVGGKISFLDAFFTSTSASCVTGLIVVDTATFFTLKGKLIIMLLIQLGGINIISFATFFVSFSKTFGGIKYNTALKDMLSSDRLSDTTNILRSIIKFSLISEAIGTIVLYFSWGNMHFDNWSDRLFHSSFHAISAFNNAGFSTFSNSLFEEGVRQLYFLQIVIMLLVFLGGFGFVALQDMFSINSIKSRLKLHWKHLNISTKITLYTSLLLIFSGALVFYFLERSNVLVGENWYQTVITSLFQSVTTRTAGFNTVDFTLLGTPVLIFFIVLMFIGAGSGSTGGGIKVTTFAVLVKTALATIKGEKNVVAFKRTIPTSTINKAYSIALFSVSMIFLSLFLLSITEPDTDFIKLVFEEVSAFATVGLSTGITSTLSVEGKIIIITSMFVGRIGTLTLAMALSSRTLYTKYQYAETSVMVG